MNESCATDWPEEVFQTLLRHDIRQVAYVPDAGHRQLIDRCIEHPAMTTIPLTTEEEGVALLAGAWLGGERGVLLMQSSGGGNCINLFSLPRVCALPLMILVTMRGEAGEFNPWQVPMGRNSEALLTTSGIETARVEDSARLAQTVDRVAQSVFDTNTAAAVLISQRILGVKTFEQRK